MYLSKSVMALLQPTTAISADYSRSSAEMAYAADTREAITALGGFSRVSTLS